MHPAADLMNTMESKAVFLSYASQDAEPARRICEALRAAGVEVWFDQNELVGGDAWDAKIRKQIAACALFVPVISATTDARPEGYFRLEWLLAVERARLMADDHPFLFPVAVGDVHEGSARVPEKFRAVQWTPLRDDASLAQFAQLIRQVLHSAAPAPTRAPDLSRREAAQPARPTPPPRPWRLWPWLLVSGAVAAILLALWWPRSASVPAPKDSSAATVAVLPFVVTGSAAAEGEIAETLHDDVISTLARIRALRVLSREAMLPYREGVQRHHRTLAQQLGASAIVDVALRSENARLRLDARLLNAHTGLLEWSDTLYSEIDSPAQRTALAGALTRKIAAALHVTLTGARRRPCRLRRHEMPRLTRSINARVPSA